MTSVSDQAATGRHPAPGPHPATPGDRLLSAAEVAAILGGSYTAGTVVRRWRKWELHGHRIGKQLRWWESDVYAWINSHPS